MKKKIILLSVLATMFMTGCRQEPPETVVDNFYKATQTKDFEQALTFTNLTDKEKEPLLALLSNMDMEIYEYEIYGSNIDEGDTSATVYIRLVTSNKSNPQKEEVELNIPCVRQGRDWKVKFL